MFHYRLTLTDNKLRMLLAAVIAFFIHLGVIGFPVGVKQVLIPDVHLPQSVSIFMGQSSKDLPIEEQVSVPIERHISPETVTTTPVASMISFQEEEEAKQDRSALLRSEKGSEVLSAAPKEKTLPAVREIAPVLQKSGLAADGRQSETDTSAEMQREEGDIISAAEQEENVGLQPGTIQTASPQYQLNSPPSYPGLARKRGQEGTVLLQVLVNKEGRVDDLEIEVSSGFALLDRAAETAVRKWLFDPAVSGQQKISMWVRVPVTFRLRE